MTVNPDARKSLKIFKEEWKDCTKCNLGTLRDQRGKVAVFGEGTALGGVMFVGEGPGWEEEEEGRPFIGNSGRLLRKVIQALHLEDYYISNAVACRSCEAAVNARGETVVRKNFKTGQEEILYADKAPNKIQVGACLPRLQEEIYLVDPIVIVSLGAIATEALTGHAVSIQKDRGMPEEITIPGAGVRPVITEKRKAWARKMGDSIVMPTEQNRVAYTLIPAYHPAFVLRKSGDFSEDNPFKRFVNDIRFAVTIYHRYLLEVFGEAAFINRIQPLTNDEEIDYAGLLAEEEGAGHGSE